MTRISRTLLLLISLCLTLPLPPALPAGQAKRPINEKDLFRFTWVADPQMSPDGSQVAYVQVTANQEKDAYESSLWLVSTQGGKPRRLTNGPQDSAPCWSPDGTSLAFVRVTEKDGKPQPSQLHLLPLAGGEPRALTSLPKGASSPAWSPDGKKIVFLSTTTADDLANPGKSKDRVSDVRIVTRATFRADSAGYLDPGRPVHLWSLTISDSDQQAATPKQLTMGEFTESQPAFSQDGSLIYFTSVRTREPAHQTRLNELYVIPAQSGEIKKVAGILGSVGRFSLSRDGKHIAFRGIRTEPIVSYAPPGLYVVDTAAGATPRCLTDKFDFDVGGLLTGDQHAPRAAASSRPLWSADGTAIIDGVARHGRANLHRFGVKTGGITPLTKGDHEVVSTTASADGTKLALLIATLTNIGDIFLSDAAGGPLKQLTHVNAKLFDELNFSAPEEITYASFDGKIISAWVQKPPGFDPKKKYPLILNIHGGPHAAYGHTFAHEMHWMAAKGYVVLYPNPRGSSSYGQEFGNIIQHRYPGDDFKDLMAGVDELIRRGYIDPKKLGVTGGSGGGLLTNWVITQTDRFAAAVSQRSIADWSAWWYSADFTLFKPSWFKDAPFNNPQEYADRSPLTYVHKIKTPLMLIEGEVDYRTPPASGGEAMFRALLFLKKPVVMVRFPGESHELSRSGKPWHRVERLQHIVNWFDRYLQDKAMPQYDIGAGE